MGIEIIEKMSQNNVKDEKNEPEKHEKEEKEGEKPFRRESSIEKAAKATIDLKLNDGQKHVFVQLLSRFLRYCRIFSINYVIAICYTKILLRKNLMKDLKQKRL